MPRIIAFDLGHANVKATVWNLSGRKATFVERWMRAVPHGAPDELVARQMAALDALLAEHPEAKASGTIIGASLGGAAVSLTRVELPFTDAKQVATTLPFAVEEAVPFDVSDRILSWRVLRAEGTTRALVALAEQEPLRAMIQSMAGRGVEPRRVFATAELLSAWDRSDEPAPVLDADGETGPTPLVVVLDLGAGATRIVALREGTVAASHALDVGGADITRAIADALGCSWNNAERLKCGLAPEPDPDEDAEAIADDDATDPGEPTPRPTAWDALPPPGIENLPPSAKARVARVIDRTLAEIRAALIGFEDALGGEVTQIVLGGGASRLPGLAGRLQADLAVPVAWAAGPGGQPVPCEFLLSDAAAATLAGEDPTPRIDLRAGALRWRSGFDAMQAVTTYGSVLVLFFTLALGGIYAWQTWSLQTEIGVAQTRIEETIRGALGAEKVNGELEAMTAMRRRIDEANARAATLRPGAAPPTVDIVHQLSTVLPGPNDLEIDVDTLNFTPRALTFDAEVPSYAAAEQVELALKSAKKFESCTKSNEQQRRGRILFTMTCPLDQGAAEKEG
jgi:Tfp pilus assembly PilM family ATPase